MGRLIDDIALKASITANEIIETNKPLEDIIDEQPTAYDIEAVVKELETLKMQYYLTIANTGDEKLYFAYKEVGNAIDKAIEIVRNGGVK